jgi:hypothetical protein
MNVLGYLSSNDWVEGQVHEVFKFGSKAQELAMEINKYQQQSIYQVWLATENCCTLEWTLVGKKGRH